MPVEGLENTTETTAATTSDETAKNTDTQHTSGADTDTAQQTQAQTTEKTFTQADVDRIVANRIKSGVKAELKKLSGDGEDKTNVEDLQRQLSERETKIRSYEARETVETFLTDGRNKLNVKPENVRGIQAIVIPQLEYDDDGKPSNLKEAIENAKSLAPALFANTPSSINAAAGRNAAAPANDMNSFIRQQAGYGN